MTIAYLSVNSTIIFWNFFMPGLIALDIDGTVAIDHQPINPAVVDYLESLWRAGWQLLFVTGRTYAWGWQLLESLPFPYYYAPFNGALVVHSRNAEVFSKNYLSAALLPGIEKICLHEGVEFIVYTDHHGETICYYRPHKFHPQLLEYVSYRKQRSQETWVALESFSSLPVEEFPALKCFGTFESNQKVAQALQEIIPLHVPVIRDPFNTDFSVLQITDAHVSKGNTVTLLAKHLKMEGRIIAAGDDYNDESMLHVATIAVIMETAPPTMLAYADVLAPSAAQNGIITGLAKAVQLSIRQFCA
jgi:Cof subfamily protein (haloacid dehalogenase superfamily)